MLQRHGANCAWNTEAHPCDSPDEKSIAVRESRFQTRWLQASRTVERCLPESWPTNELGQARRAWIRRFKSSIRVDCEDPAAFVEPADRKGHVSGRVIVLPGVTPSPILTERPDSLPALNRWATRGWFGRSFLCCGTVPACDRLAADLGHLERATELRRWTGNKTRNRSLRCLP